jgi:hypothetical protein
MTANAKWLVERFYTEVWNRAIIKGRITRVWVIGDYRRNQTATGTRFVRCSRPLRRPYDVGHLPRRKSGSLKIHAPVDPVDRAKLCSARRDRAYGRGELFAEIR